MIRLASLLLIAALTVCGCAPSAKTRRGDGSPPWSSLTSPTAVLKVALDEVCLPAILDNRPISELAEARYLVSVPPRSTGSSQATAAWRLGSWHEIYVMQLPNGGCSVSLEAGNAQDLAASAVEMAQARTAFTRGLVTPARNGEAENTAWCSAGNDRPVVVGVMRKLSGRGPALMVNVFRAEAARPSFCSS
jgi:hypothetical protein